MSRTFSKRNLFFGKLKLFAEKELKILYKTGMMKNRREKEPAAEPEGFLLSPLSRKQSAKEDFPYVFCHRN